MVEISVSYGETSSKDYNSEKHELSIKVFLTDDQLLERSVEQWYFYYNNMLKKAVREMFGTEEKKEPTVFHQPVPKKGKITEIAYEEVSAIDQGSADPTNVIYGSVKAETEKALLIVDANASREGWIPKSCLKSGDAKSTKFVVHDWFVDEVKWE